MRKYGDPGHYPPYVMINTPASALPGGNICKRHSARSRPMQLSLDAAAKHCSSFILGRQSLPTAGTWPRAHVARVAKGAGVELHEAAAAEIGRGGCSSCPIQLTT